MAAISRIHSPPLTPASGDSKQLLPPLQITVDVHVPDTPEKKGGLDEVGQAGDAFGSLNALLSAVAGFFLILAAVFQYLQLRYARIEYKDESKARGREQFESTFFQLLNYTRKIEEKFLFSSTDSNFERDLKRQIFIEKFNKRPNAYSRIEIKKVKNNSIPKLGSDALSQYAYRLNRLFPGKPEASAEEQMVSLVDTFHRKIYNRHPSWFGPYFRVLYQTFKHIHNSPLDEDEKIEFSNIARGQIGEAAVFLLAVNAWGPWGYKFVGLIEEYGLLEHMHKDFRKKYEKIFRSAFSERAFMGSKARRESKAQELNQWEIPEEGRFLLEQGEMSLEDVDP